MFLTCLRIVLHFRPSAFVFLRSLSKRARQFNHQKGQRFNRFCARTHVVPLKKNFAARRILSGFAGNKQIGTESGQGFKESGRRVLKA